MLHLIKWKIQNHWPKKIVFNGQFGVEVFYNGVSTEGFFYLHPYIDDTNKTVKYFCFESIDQKLVFEKLCKISGVGPKTAFNISDIPALILQEAVDSFDTSILEQVQWIGKKTAKKIMVELKDSLSVWDITKINTDNKVFNNIVKTLTTMGYEKEKVSQALHSYPEEIKKDNVQEIVIWLINSLR